MVHFTLVVTCLGLAAVAQTGHETKVQRALEDVSFAITLQSSLPGLWLDKQVEDTIYNARRLGSIDGIVGGNFKASGIKLSDPLINVVYIRIPSNLWTIWSKETLDAVRDQSGELGSTAHDSLLDTTESDTFAGFDLRGPETIGEFRELWSFLGLIDQISILALGPQNSDGSYSVKWMEEDESTGQFSSVDISLFESYQSSNNVAHARLIANWDIRTNKPVGIFFHLSEEWVTVGPYMPSKFDPFSIWISANSVLVDFHPQLLLSKEFSEQPRAGDFDDVFPELSSLTTDLSETSLHDLRRLLTNQGSQSDARVEVFGVSVPGDSLAIWGNAILFGILMFLFLHLRKFTDEVSNVQGYQYPWIGLYADKVSFTSCLITAVVLPVTVSVLLLLNGVTVIGVILLVPVIAGSWVVGSGFLTLHRHINSRKIACSSPSSETI